MNIDELSAKICEKYFSLATDINIVAEIDGEIYRLMTDCELGNHYTLLFRDEFSAMKNAFNAGLIRTECLGKDSQGRVILKHEKISTQSWWYEWTLPQIRDIAIMILKVQKGLLHTHSYIIDPNTWNVTFYYTRPVFFDFGSITAGEIDPLLWLRVFWLGGNRLQSWQDKLGITWAELQELLIKKEFQSIDAHINYLQKLQFSELRPSEWSRYDKHHFKFEDESTWQRKHVAVKKLLEIAKPQNVFEIGSNTGEFTKMMLKLGVNNVIANDIDDHSIRILYDEAKKNCLPITPVCFDVFHTYNYFGGGTRRTHLDDWRMQRLTALERFKSDCVLAVALTHHICYWREMNFDTYAKIISTYSKKYVIVEWVPQDDVCLEGKINKFGENREWYTEENFIKAFLKYFPGTVFEVQSSPEKRKMFLFGK